MDGAPSVAGWIEAASGIATGCGLLGYAVRGRSSSLLAPSIYHGDRSRATLALTFDDGPSESTPALLDILSRHQVRATFFMCGQNVRRLPQIARDVSARGHEIGNHTDTHPRFDFKSPAFIYGEMARAQESIQISTGVTPFVFRAPFGVRWFGLRRAQERLGLTGVMWSFIARDWKWPAAQVSGRLIQSAANGAILCLHDGRTVETSPDIHTTLEAVDTALPRLLERGFTFETVGRMLDARSLL